MFGKRRNPSNHDEFAVHIKRNGATASTKRGKQSRFFLFLPRFKNKDEVCRYEHRRAEG